MIPALPALSPAAAARLYPRLAAELGSGPVLDIGTGSGVEAAALRAHGARPVLFDVADWRNGPIGPFALADGAALPVRSGCCDGVHVARVLAHVPDWRLVLTEVVRVLAPGGALCLSLGDRPYAGPLRELTDRAAALAERAGYRQTPPAAEPPSEAATGELLSRLGCARTATIEVSDEVTATPREALRGVLGNPFRWAPGQDLTPVAERVLAEAGLPADAPVARVRTVVYSVFRRD